MFTNPILVFFIVNLLTFQNFIGYLEEFKTKPLNKAVTAIVCLAGQNNVVGRTVFLSPADIDIGHNSDFLPVYGGNTTPHHTPGYPVN